MADADHDDGETGFKNPGTLTVVLTVPHFFIRVKWNFPEICRIGFTETLNSKDWPY